MRVKDESTGEYHDCFLDDDGTLIDADGHKLRFSKVVIINPSIKEFIVLCQEVFEDLMKTNKKD